VILATVTGNPACTASQTTLNSLLAQVDNFDDIDEVPDFAPLPFTDGGQAVVQHYLSNRDASFLYCAQASAGAESLDMSVELQLSLTVTVDLL